MAENDFQFPECETYLEIEFEMSDLVENSFSVLIDKDIFLLALILQVLRSCCSEDPKTEQD